MDILKQLRRLIVRFLFIIKIIPLMEKYLHSKKRKKEIKIFNRILVPSKNEFKEGFRILIYHRITEVKDNYSIDTLSVEDFKSQMRYIKSNYDVLPLDVLIGDLREGKIHNNALAVTFDDGYQDLYHFAFPILKSYQISATIFLVTDLIGTDQILWFDRALLLIKNCSVDFLEYNDFGIELNLDLKTENERLLSSDKLLGALKRLKSETRDCILDDLENRYTIHINSNDYRKILQWDQIEDMHQNGVFFGPHTTRHSILTTLSDKEIEWEIETSQAKIEDHLQSSVNVFAYPNGNFGDFNDFAKKFIKKSGFKGAVSTIKGFNSIDVDLYELRRSRPWQDNAEFFAAGLLQESFQFIRGK
jgi:peptidoglycan/xylan/chitin deacetylase (PgdA/CDA1 family)